MSTKPWGIVTNSCFMLNIVQQICDNIVVRNTTTRFQCHNPHCKNYLVLVTPYEELEDCPVLDESGPQFRLLTDDCGSSGIHGQFCDFCPDLLVECL